MSSSQWKIHFKSAPSEVYRAISTPLGRSRFWAQSAKEANGIIHFVLPGGRTDDAEIERAVKDHRYVLRYFGHRLTFTLSHDTKTNTDTDTDGNGSGSGSGSGSGTDLTLTCDPETASGTEHASASGIERANAGTGGNGEWVSLLFRLKGHVDFGVDLRNHDETRHDGYVDGG